MADLGRCSGCGIGGTGIMLDGEPVCDRCADYRLSVITGWPTLPDPPAPEVIIGPDDRKHFIRYRLLRMPTAVLALAEELGVPAGSGYRLEIHCNHFADPGLLVPRIQAQAQAAVAHPYLEPNEWHGWRLPGHELGGRLEEEEDEQGTAGPRVVVDGRSLSWEDLGNLLKPYVGWTLELRLDSEFLPREGDTSGKITVRPPTKTELRAATRVLRQTAGGYFLDSAHYPSRDEWADGRHG